MGGGAGAAPGCSGIFMGLMGGGASLPPSSGPRARAKSLLCHPGGAPEPSSGCCNTTLLLRAKVAPSPSCRADLPPRFSLMTSGLLWPPSKQLGLPSSPATSNPTAEGGPGEFWRVLHVWRDALSHRHPRTHARTPTPLQEQGPPIQTPGQHFLRDAPPAPPLEGRQTSLSLADRCPAYLWQSRGRGRAQAHLLVVAAPPSPQASSLPPVPEGPTAG